MKYHYLFLLKIRKDVANLSSAAVVIGALRVKLAEYKIYAFIFCQSVPMLNIFYHFPLLFMIIQR